MRSWLPIAPEPTVLGRRLAVVAPLAERLPVGPVPEQTHIAMVRNNVVDNGRRLGPTAMETHHTERVFGQVGQPGRLPPPVVAAYHGGRPTPGVRPGRASDAVDGRTLRHVVDPRPAGCVRRAQRGPATAGGGRATAPDRGRTVLTTRGRPSWSALALPLQGGSAAIGRSRVSHGWQLPYSVVYLPLSASERRRHAQDVLGFHAVEVAGDRLGRVEHGDAAFPGKGDFPVGTGGLAWQPQHGVRDRDPG
jgi:hypothetical protein